MDIYTPVINDPGISAHDQLSKPILQGVPTMTAPVQLFGYVFLVEGYAAPAYTGCHALVKLRDTPPTTVAVMTTSYNLQSLLETALITGNLIQFVGEKLQNPPTPRGGTWSADVYNIDGVILYNIK